MPRTGLSPEIEVEVPCSRDTGYPWNLDFTNNVSVTTCTLMGLHTHSYASTAGPPARPRLVISTRFNG
jgi:hypothetical protein